MKTIKIELELGDGVEGLWQTSSKSFFKDDVDRFSLIEGKPVKDNHMYFFDRYLEAKVWQAVLKQNKIASALYHDSGTLDFVVLSEKEFSP